MWFRVSSADGTICRNILSNNAVLCIIEKMSMKSHIWTLTVCLLVTGRIAAQDESRVVRTYALEWANAREIYAAVNELLGDKGRAFKNNSANRLIVATSSNLHIRVESLLRELDVPVPNVRLDVIMTGAERSTDIGLDISVSNPVKITHRGNAAHFEFSPNIRAQTTRMESRTQQTLVVQSGKEGVINVGDDIPYAEWLYYYGCNHGYINTDLDFRTERIGSSLIATPQVIGTGPLVLVTLVPEIRMLSDGKYRHFRFARAATTVTARNGQPITIGGTAQNRKFYDKFLAGFTADGNITSTQIILVPHISYPETSRKTFSR